MGGEGRRREERTARRRDRARRAAATVVLAAAVVITAATSYVDAEVGEELAGVPFLLTPEEPVVTVPVTFAATPEAFEGSPRVLLHMSHTVVWTGVEDASAELLDVQVVPHDSSDGSPHLSDGYCRLDECITSCHGSECVGSYDVVFRWPEHLREGSARVEWSVEGRFTWPDDGGFFSSTPEPAEGTELWLEFGELTGGATPPAPVVAWETAVEGDVAVVEESVTVVTGGSLDGGVLALESRFEPGSLRVALPNGWDAGEPPTHLATASSTPIPVPDHCHDGPCTFAFGTLAQLVRPAMFSSSRSRGARVDWAITATTPIDVEVVSRRASVPELVAQAHLGRIVLEGGEATDELRFAVTIPAGVLSSDEWPPNLADHVSVEDTPNHPAHDIPAAGAGPVVMLELRPDIDPAALGMRPHPGLHLQVVVGQQPPAHVGEHLANWFEQATAPSQWGPWRTALRNDCLPDQTCEIELGVVAETRYRDPPDGDPVVAFDLDVEVVVLLPWTQPAPSETPTIRLATDPP